MRINFFPQKYERPGSWLLVLFLLSTLAVSLSAQTTISTGSIQGTVTDPSGAAVADAKVTITDNATGNVISLATNSSGVYASGALTPGQYVLRIEARGFKIVDVPITVQVNTTSAGNVKLALGEGRQVIEVHGTEIAVNTEQATVQGVLTSQQIQNLPINGRNFLDLAQLEPGVQIQDGGTFDPTKNGFSSVSFGGRFGRTARIEVDGVDISDETVGTTTQNLPIGAIQESSLQQSSLDLSTELTSSGSVNITTKSGTNGLHGDAFYYFRDQSLNAALPGGSTNPFQRNQFGGSLGGPIVKNKLFFFVDAERTKQDLLDPVLPGGAFAGLTGSFTSPFRETETIGRLDWQTSRFKMFYRFTYDQSKSVLPFIPNSFQPFANVNHTRGHVVGADFSLGSFTNSIRFGYTKFQNGIADAVSGSSIFDPAPGIELAIGGDPFCLTAGLDDFCSGPNFLAPQATLQSDRQIKYDGSKLFKSHILRFGMGFNHVQGGGFAKFLGLAPAVGSPSLAAGADLPCVTAGNCPFPNGNANPLNYPVDSVTLGNGQGFSSEKPAFGLPGGGLGPDNRFSWYIGDSWKARSNFTVTAGVRYVRDTGRTDSDIGHIAALDQFNNQFFSGLGNPVRQPNHNFAPQLGIAWDPRNNGKTVVRAGIGLFYENSVWNNNLFDRPARLEKGLFLGFQGACPGSAFCGQPIGTVASDIIAAQQEFQATTLANGPAINGSFIGNILADNAATSTNLIAPNYQTPRSVQMNFGIQREIRPGTVVTVDYLRNVATHTLLIVDTNHVGDARFFNLTAAQNAIAQTLAACGVGSIDAAIAACPGLHPGVNGGPPGPATISDFASAKFDANGVPLSGGLDSGYSTLLGLPASLTCDPTGSTCLTPDTGAAFPGINPGVGANQMLHPIGRSVYNGLQATLKQDLGNPLPGVRHLNLQVSYSFSRYVSTARDGDFINFSTDNAHPTRFIGPNGLDRTQQISFGGFIDLPAHFQMGLTSHFYSPLPSNVTLPVSGLAGGLFQTDVTGDGTGDGSVASNRGAGDLLPGSNIGAFGRDFGVSGLNKAITNYNNTMVGQATPAGQVLIDNNLMTLTQLQELGGVIGGSTPSATAPFGPLQLAPAGAVGQAWLKSFDLNFSWAYKIKERFEIRPGIAFFNLFNFANFDGPAAPFSNILDGSPGSPNGTTSPQPVDLRLGLGSGVNALGAPRQIEFSLKINF
jgi:Carboxypeptidase regulatory-like domain